MKEFLRIIFLALWLGLIFCAAESNGQIMVFSESMGTVSVQTSVPDHETNNGFDNDGLTMTQGGASNLANLQLLKPTSEYQRILEFKEEPLIIPYFNGFTTQEDLDLALSQGFNINKAEYSSGIGGYLKIDYSGFLETPEINFSEHNHLNLSFRINKPFLVPSVVLGIYISGDGGDSYQFLFSLNVVEGSNINFPLIKRIIDLDDFNNVTNGKLKFVVTTGVGAFARFKELSINDVSVWRGTQNNSWENTINWTTYVPGPKTEVTIGPSNNNPVISNFREVGSLTIQQNTTLTIASIGQLTVGGTLTNNAETDGLVIESGGSIIHNTENVYASVERTIEAANWTDGTEGWHLISAPVANQAINEGWTPTGNNNNYDFYAWCEGTQTWLNQKVSANEMTHFLPGKGYFVSYQQGNTKTFSHMLNNEDVIQQLTRTENSPYSGWNLLGNPYPSAIKWNTGSWGDLAAMKLNAHAWVWNRIAKSYTTIAPGGVIPAMNGFMVQLTDGSETQITIPGAERIHDSQHWYKSIDTQLIRLIAFEQDDHSYQESTIFIHPGTSETFNAYHDARFLPGFAPLFYSKKEAENLSVYSVPDIHDELVIPFEFIKNQANHFRIELDEVAEGTRLYLFDRKLNLEHPLAVESPYEFSSANGDDPLRFELRFSPAGATDISGLSEGLVHIYVWNNTLYLRFSEEAANRLLQLYDLSGRLVMSHKLDHGLSHTQQLHVDRGVYVVKISSLAGVSTKRVFVK